MDYREAHAMFKGTRYAPTLQKIEEAILNGDKKVLPVLLAQLPTRSQLMTRLDKDLKGTSTFKNLKAASKGKGSKWTDLKAVASLMTRLAIECEHGRDEYAPILAETVDMFDRLPVVLEMRRRVI